MGIRSWLVHRAMGRLRIDDDTIRHLSTFQRLGEALEVELPSELLPVGARWVFRALRTRAAAQVAPDWVWPWWLERQLDPTSRAFIPRGHLPFLTNVTARNWTAVGNLDSPWEAVVDPRGLVTPWLDGWSLDWWIGADDRWHLPSRETAVRQRLLDATPVVETAMRIPGGDAVHRAYATRDGDTELVVVEVTNASPVPFAVAFAVRPYNPEGLSVVERIELHDRTVVVDGRPAVLLPRAPSMAAASTFRDGDVAGVVLGGGAGRTMGTVRCPAGLAQAAVLYPVPHGTSIRVALPVRPVRRTRRRGLVRRRVGRIPDPAHLPGADRVAAGWRAHTDRRGMRVELPDARLNELVDANRRFLLVLHDGDDVTPGPFTYHRFWFRDAAFMLGALDRWGFHAEVARVLATYEARQRVDGFYFSQRREWDANGAALWALAEHWRLTRDAGLATEMAASIARGAQWITRKRRSRRRRRSPETVGLLPPGISAEHLGPHDHYYWDSFWGVRGLRDAAELLEAAGHPDAARRVRVDADAAWSDVEASLALVAERNGSPVIPAGPRRRTDHGIIGSLVACWPLRLMTADDPRIVATAEAVRDRYLLGPAFYQGISHTGLGTYLTLQLAFVELEAGDRRALERLDWMVGAASDTGTWPEAIHPTLGGGCMGDGHHGWAAADFLSFVRNLLVRDVGSPEAPGLALCTLVPGTWWGRPVEVHDAPTWAGVLSFGVRWHGDRPALLWELRPHPGLGPVPITVPGLDPGFRTTEPSGEALLAPVPPPAGADVPPASGSLR